MVVSLVKIYVHIS